MRVWIVLLMMTMLINFKRESKRPGPRKAGVGGNERGVIVDYSVEPGGGEGEEERERGKMREP